MLLVDYQHDPRKHGYRAYNALTAFIRARPADYADATVAVAAADCAEWLRGDHLADGATVGERATWAVGRHRRELMASELCLVARTHANG